MLEPFAEQRIQRPNGRSIDGWSDPADRSADLSVHACIVLRRQMLRSIGRPMD